MIKILYFSWVREKLGISEELLNTKANNIISNEVSFFLPFISGESNHLKVPVRVVSHISSTVHTR